MEAEVHLPSGLKGIIRGLKVKDEKILTDRRLIQSGKMISTLLTNCWLKTADAGPYTLQGDNPNWDSVINVDRTSAIIQLRMASYGENYDFEVTCNNEVCMSRFGWTVNLADFVSHEVAPAALEHIRTGEPLKIGVAGKVFGCRLLTGADERYFAQLRGKGEDAITAHHLARQIIEIPDVKPMSRAILEALDDLDSIDADGLRDTLDEVSGGIDTTFAAECPSCYAEQTLDLPFEAGFFSKRKRFAQSKTRNSGTT